MNKNFYSMEKYFYKNKDKVITNLKVDAHELYLIRQACKAENIETKGLEEAFSENIKILNIINDKIPALKKAEARFDTLLKEQQRTIDTINENIKESLKSLKLDNLEPGETL